MMARWRVHGSGLFAWVAVTIAAMSGAQAQIVDPRDFSGLAFWADAGDINGNGVQPANGSLVTQWNDKSGGGFHLTGASTTAPFYQATGFDGVNPAIRLRVGKFLAGPNPFGGFTATQPQNAITVFLAASNNTATLSAAISLNGDNAGASALGGRYAMQVPSGAWNVIFDAGGCCLNHRISAVNPNAFTDTAIYTALSNGTTREQVLRIDGLPAGANNLADPVRVNQGIRLSAFDAGNFEYFDGRIGEIIVYKRALSPTEYQLVECYLLRKWKWNPATAPTLYPQCMPQITTSKTVVSWNNGVNPVFNIPGNDVSYTLTITRSTGVSLDKDSVFVIDRLPAALTFFNGDADGAGPGTTPVIYAGSGNGLSFNYATDVRYATGTMTPTSISACTYTPVAGYDPNVRFICINPKGAFSTSTPTSSFTLKFRAKIN